MSAGHLRYFVQGHKILGRKIIAKLRTNFKSSHCCCSSVQTSFVGCRDMSTSRNQEIVSIFTSAVNSVLPHQMIRDHVKLDGNGKTMTVNGTEYNIDHNVYVVGFGKAVLGMARAVNEILEDHIVSGLLSVPIGCQENFRQAGKMDMLLDPNSRIIVTEGAKNNMPDKPAYQTASKIQQLVLNLKEKDILIVLISGGGSSLLPLPMPPVTLEEQLEMTQLMSRGGATIDEMNIIRKNIEVLKGGGLARQAIPAKVISLIMSDVIGDKIEIISSGPTVADKSTPQQSLLILKKLGIEAKVPESIKTLLTKRTKELTKSTTSEEYTGGSQWAHVNNVIVGSNKTALSVASTKAEDIGYLPIVLSSVLDGEASKIGGMFGMLARYIIHAFSRKPSDARHSDNVQLELDLVTSGVPKKILKKVVDMAGQSYNANKPICILTGGETTVNVKGTGLGGRNQEMVLGCALELDKLCHEDTSVLANYNITFLSAGTDGIDGPTPAAGAVIDHRFIQRCRDKKLDAEAYLLNNDSYNLFKTVDEDSLIQVGHTGTNVMDIQILLVQNR